MVAVLAAIVGSVFAFLVLSLMILVLLKYFFQWLYYLIFPKEKYETRLLSLDDYDRATL